MLRGAFVGFGNVAAEGHLPGWKTAPGVAMVAATDATASRRAVFEARCPGGRWFDSIEALLAGARVDFVDICTPPGSHAGLATRALEAGLHVLCEKPLVTRAEDAAALARAAQGRVLHTVHNWLEAPLCRKISALIAEGAVGQVRSLDWQTLRSRPAVTVGIAGAANWRVDPVVAGGGILFDHGWHALYCLLRWAGAAPESITATLETKRHHEWPIEDTATVELGFRGASGRIFLTWTADERANQIAIMGADGRIHVERETVVLTTHAGERRWTCPPALSEGSHHPDWFAGVAADFQAAIAGNGRSNLDEALLCAKLIGLAQHSSAEGGARLKV
jgi:predicted dehydrogenase